jgi:hypothetical protein
MKEIPRIRDGATAHCLLRDACIWVFVLHSTHPTAPFYLSELTERLDASVDSAVLGRAAVAALGKARDLKPEEQNFPDAMNALRGKKSYKAFHRGMGLVGISFNDGKIHVGGWQADGPGHVPVASLNRSLARTAHAAMLGKVILKFLCASQQINIPVVGWDRRKVKPL